MSETTASPLPTKKPEERVNFFTALEAVVNGKHITKVEWENTDIYGFLDVDILKLHKEDGKNYNWIVSEGDLIGSDWIVL